MGNHRNNRHIHKIDKYEDEKCMDKVSGGKMSPEYDEDYVDLTINDLEENNSDLAAQSRQILKKFRI